MTGLAAVRDGWQRLGTDGGRRGMGKGGRG